MLSIKGHFDGNAIVLDEPATLEVGQSVRIVVEAEAIKSDSKSPRKSLAGFAKGMFEMREDFNEPLEEFLDYR